jgi:hypothetical protein
MNHTTTAKTITAPASLLEQIARQHLSVQTLQTQHADRLDFHEVSVWGIEAALQAAFAAGQQAAAKKPQADQKDLKTA